MYPSRTVCLVDTLGASPGEGIPALRAAGYRGMGRSLTETAELPEADCKRMCQILTVDNLMYLRRGGRLSGISAPPSELFCLSSRF